MDRKFLSGAIGIILMAIIPVILLTQVYTFTYIGSLATKQDIKDLEYILLITGVRIENIEAAVQAEPEPTNPARELIKKWEEGTKKKPK